LKGKLILKQLLAWELPRELFERPKSGFSVPVGDWMRGALRPWAEELLDPKTLRAEGWFDAEAVHARWREHSKGVRDHTPSLWSILMFQAWLREQESAAGQAESPALAVSALQPAVD